MNIPSGKGIYIWHLDQCFVVDMERLVDKLAEANFNHVSIKAQEGIWSYTHQAWHWHPNQQDRLVEVVPLLKERGIEVWLWGYLRGNYYGLGLAEKEAAKTVELVKKYGAAYRL